MEPYSRKDDPVHDVRTHDDPEIWSAFARFDVHYLRDLRFVYSSVVLRSRDLEAVSKILAAVGSTPTELSTTNANALLNLQCSPAVCGIKELYKPVRLLDGYLSQFSMLMKDVKQVTLCDLLGWEIAFFRQ